MSGKGVNANGQRRSPFRAGIAAATFITVAILVAVGATLTGVDTRVVAVGIGVIIVVVLGVPTFVRWRTGKRGDDDEADTCEPIMAAYKKSRSTDKLLADYDAWKQGEHSTYTRMHFGAQVIDALRDAKEYERALEVLHDLDTLDFKLREHYDYDKYRAECEPQLLEGARKEKKRAEERARNKSRRKK